MEALSQHTLYLMVGPPGCGKSMVAWQLVSKGALRVSGDDLFFAITDRTHSHWRPHRVMEAVNAAADVLMEGLVERGLPVIADRTHLSVRARSRPIAIARRHGYAVEALLWLNFDEARERNARRSGRDRVPEEIWQAMAQTFERPTQEEGIDRIRVVAAPHGA